MGMGRSAAGPSPRIKGLRGLCLLTRAATILKLDRDAASNHCLPLTIFRYDAFKELCCYDNYYDPPLTAGQWTTNLSLSSEAKSLLSNLILVSSRKHE